MRKRILLAVMLGALVATGANAQKRAFTIPDLYRVQYAAGPTVSAKGQLAYYVSSSDLKSQTSKTTLYIDHQPLEGIKGFAPQWSADGSKLYYSAVADDGLQVFAYDLKTRQSRQLTHYALGANGAVVSPDGNLIAFAAEVWPAIGGAHGTANAEANKRKAKAPVQAHLADKRLLRHRTAYTDGQF